MTRRRTGRGCDGFDHCRPIAHAAHAAQRSLYSAHPDSHGCSLPQVHVFPLEHPKSVAAIAATHITKPAEGQLSRKQRRCGAGLSPGYRVIGFMVTGYRVAG